MKALSETAEKKPLLPSNSLQALQVEKEVFDFLKPLLKPDVTPEDLNLIWNLPLYQALKLNAITKALELKTCQTAKIDCASSGNNIIVAGVTGKKIKVYAIKVVFAGTVTAKFCSVSTDLEGAQPFQAREGYTHAVNPPAFLLATAVGEALNLNLSDAIGANGSIAYWDDDAT